MKPLLLFIMMGMSVTVFAQVQRVPAFPKLPKKYLDQQNVVAGNAVQTIPPKSEKRIQSPAPAQRAVTTIIDLPQDRMPCVIPSKEFYSMPVVTEGKIVQMRKIPGAMPNPAKPVIIGK